MGNPTKIKFLVQATVLGGATVGPGDIVTIGDKTGQTSYGDAMTWIRLGYAQAAEEVEGEKTMTTKTAAGVLKDETKGKGK